MTRPAHPLLPSDFPESTCSNILKLFDDAEAAIMNVTTLAKFNPSAKITRHNISLFAQLPEAHKEAEIHVVAFVEVLYHANPNEEVENSYYTDFHPNYVDAPTPWLYTLICYFNQNPMIEAHMSEDQPPTPSLSAMVG
ncbi:hypothetical protein L0F63_001710 [Massospora cicadina]|nr:hypothetical protein L0F63_001710 [Massospora cicadina]